MQKKETILKGVTDPFLINTDRDELDELHIFEQRPLYKEGHLSNSKTFRIVNGHLKNKWVFSALEWATWWNQLGQIRLVQKIPAAVVI